MSIRKKYNISSKPREAHEEDENNKYGLLIIEISKHNQPRLTNTAKSTGSTEHIVPYHQEDENEAKLHF